jgi:hypothetical protein
MVASLVLATLATVTPLPNPTAISVEHFSIEIPPGYEAGEASPPMMDFDLYRVTRRGSKAVACVLYFGNAPNFPQLHWSEKPIETKGDQRITKAHQRRGAIEGLLKFSGLSYKSQTGSPFTFIHYAGEKLDDVAIKDMLKMIASIKVVRPHLD